MENQDTPQKLLTYTSKTDEELKQIARDLFVGQIFCDRQIKGERIDGVFMPLAFMDRAQVQRLKDLKIDLIYEYLTDAAPRSCNGLPIFFSFKCLDEADSEKMLGYWKKLVEASESL